MSVLQFSEGLSDRQADEAVRGRIDWKYLHSPAVLQSREDQFYNYQRPYGALDGQSAYELLRQKADLQD